MLAHREIPLQLGSAKLVSREALQNYDVWPRAFAGKWKDHRYYEIVDLALSGFEHHYLVLQDRGGKIRGVQPIFFVRQNLIEGVAGKVVSAVGLVRKVFPRFLTMRVLMVGCAAGAGELGAASREDQQWMAEALPEALQSLARQTSPSLIVFKDFYAKYRGDLDSLGLHGYIRFPSMPMTRLSLEHASFDDYLASIGYTTRKSLRRKFRKTERAPKIDMEVVTDITPYLDEIYPLYLQVHERSRMKFETLTKDYFREVSQRMPDRARFFIWRQEGRIIAFALCFVHEETLYDECIGLDYGLALDLHLYFYTLRDVIRWGISQKLRAYCSGPLNYDPKLHLGCVLMPLDLYVMHTSPVVNPIFRRIIKYLGPTRHDPLLRQFPNANEL
jgi:predicted N-acyltransferase